jgi:hypothetical protein
MAFNPLHSFQRNKRFWMAAILMICMISFVFCTGMRGDMSERLPQMFGLGSRGTTVANIAGHAVTRRDLDDLKAQRNLANDLMLRCGDMAFKNLSKKFYEENKKVGDADKLEARRENLAELYKRRATVAYRKSKPRYFDIGVKFDDLLEFKLWQAEADRLGIKIEDRHLDFLFSMEFFDFVSDDEKFRAQRDAMRNVRQATDQYVRRAVAEEFRVRIAQLAVLGAQPYSYLYRKQRREGDGFTVKYVNPDVPDEVRAPMTLAQLWDFYKSQRSEFGVTLLPVDAKDFVKAIPDPDDLLKRKFFDSHKNKTFDPSSDEWGMEVPSQSKVEYLYADPKSPAYLGVAKLINQVKVKSLQMPNPVAFDALQSTFHSMLLTGLRNELVAQKHQLIMQRHYEQVTKDVSRKNPYYRGAALIGEKDCAAPILAYMAGRHPQAVMSMIAANALAPMNPLESIGATAGYLAWGTKKYPLDGTTQIRDDKEKTKELTKIVSNDEELETAIRSEVKRRAPSYATLFAAGLTQFPLDIAGPYFSMDLSAAIQEEPFPGIRIARSVYIHPFYTLETVQRELEGVIALRTAEEWAQVNIQIVKLALDKAAGDGEKFKRELNRYVHELNLTYGPSDDKKNEFHDRFSITKTKEFDVLKESYLKYVDMINLFEGRDVNAGRTLKPADYYKIYFDASERFSVASSLYRAMPWPPEVIPNNARDLQFASPRLFKNVEMGDLQRFKDFVDQHDPNHQAPNLQLYKNATLPILFWRTAEINAYRPTDYKQLIAEVNQYKAELAKIDERLKNKPKDAGDLQRQQATLKKKEADLQFILDRVTEGWKTDRARTDKALPKARELAKILIEKGIDPVKREKAIKAEADELKKIWHASDKKRPELVTLTNLSQMHPEKITDFQIDYFPPPLPKDKGIDYPREDMMAQILSLYDMKSPIKIGNPQLDDINKELYELVKKEQKRDRFVQIIANKPRTVFYVAAITAPPIADREQFKEALKGARFPQENIRLDLQPLRDHFAEKAQEQQAKSFRADLVIGLGVVHNYEVTAEGEKERDRFDERAVGE